MKAFLFSLIATIFCSIACLAHTTPHPAPDAKAAHLSYRNKTIHLHVQFEKPPSTAGETTMLIQARKGSDHSPLALNAKIEVELWMPTMAHGSAPTLVTAVRSATGDYVIGQFKVTQMFFIMAGAWEVKINLFFEDGTTETQSFLVNLTESTSHQH